jgi:hypothetical protein
LPTRLKNPQKVQKARVRVTDLGRSRHPSIVLVRVFFGLVALSFVACGGRAESGSADQAQAGSGAGGGGAGAANTAETTPFYLDDFLPWFDGSGVADFPDGMQDVVLHTSTKGEPARATLSTHLPGSGLTGANTLLFSARANQPLRLLVSVGHTQRTYDYFSDAVAWPLATVDVGEKWQTFSLDMSEFVPPESEQDRAVASFYVAFIIDGPGPRELWLDDVSLKW